MSTSGILHPSIDYLRRPGKLRPQVLRRVGNVSQEIGQTAEGPLQSRAGHKNGYEVDRTYQMRWPMKRGWGYSNVSLRKVPPRLYPRVFAYSSCGELSGTKRLA